jgi:immunity protein 26 of polymorphic toxin system
MTEKAKRKRIRPNVGDIFQIPLLDGRFAYGKVFRDASVGIYQKIFDSPTLPPIRAPFAFIVGLYDDILKSGKWHIIGHEPFESEEDEWPPPNFVLDEISGEYSIYHKGEMRPSSEDECHGLERAAVWDAHHVIDRIMGGTKYLS